MEQQKQSHRIYDGSKFIITANNGDKYRLCIECDSSAENPRTWDNVATIHVWWGNYNIGDEKPEWSHNPCEILSKLYHDISGKCSRGEIARIITKINETNLALIFPVYVYEHSGITLGLSDYGDKWDSGLAGYVYITKEKAFSEFSECTDDNWKEKAKDCINAEIETLRDYVEGNVYWYRLEALSHVVQTRYYDGRVFEYDTWVETDESCGGFYGNTLEENGILDVLFVNSGIASIEEEQK